MTKILADFRAAMADLRIVAADVKAIVGALTGQPVVTTPPALVTGQAPALGAATQTPASPP